MQWLTALLIATSSTPIPPPLANTELHVLGWSGKGDRLALAQFHDSEVVSHQCELRVTILNLVDDKVLWSTKANWGDPSDGSPDTCPRDAKSAWRQIESQAQAQLAKHSIQWVARSELSAFPLQQAGDAISLHVQKTEQGAYTITLSSSARGQKVVASALESSCAELQPVGYLKSPGGDRIAIVVQGDDDLPFCPVYLVVGASLKTGFKH